METGGGLSDRRVKIIATSWVLLLSCYSCSQAFFFQGLFLSDKLQRIQSSWNDVRAFWKSQEIPVMNWSSRLVWLGPSKPNPLHSLDIRWMSKIRYWGESSKRWTAHRLSLIPLVRNSWLTRSAFTKPPFHSVSAFPLFLDLNADFPLGKAVILFSFFFFL